MDKEKHRTTNIISLILHILVIWGAFSLRSTHILTPSRSDGVEVSLIDASVLNTPPQPIITQKIITPEPIKTIDNNAEINIKQQEKAPQKKEEPKVIPKVVKPEVKPLPPIPPVPPQEVHKVPPKEKPPSVKEKRIPNANVTNALLGQLNSTENVGKSKGRTTGGTMAGTSNSNNNVNNYADLVISTVRPFVNIPDNVNSNAKAIVKVVLLPNMQVYQVKLTKSSGNSDYDDNVQQAIWKVKVFPPIPAGEKWTDYRVLYLSFRPSDN